MTWDEVRRAFDNSVSDASQYQSWIAELDDARLCKWNGQSTDGRKHEHLIGREVFPWDMASDIRPFFIDDLINDDVDICRTADKNCHMQTVPTNSTFQQQATSQTAVIDYVNRAWMAEELEREKELLCQWRQHYGSAVMAIDWWMDFDSEQVTVTMQQLQQLGQQDPQFGAMMQYLQDNMQQLGPADLAAAASMFQQYFPQVKDIQGALQSLMQTGQFSYDNPYTKESRPCVTALRSFQDVFFNRGAFDLQSLPWIVRRDVLGRPSVEDRAKYEQWDPGFTKDVLAHAGEQIVAMSGWGSNDSMRFAGDRLYVDEMRDFCEVFYAFYKGQDPSGHRRIMVTIFHPSTKTVGRTLPNPYLHGKYPFVLCMREKRSRSAIESRGVGDIEMTHQSEIKNQRDSRNDRTSLGTLPPLQVPLGRGKAQYKLGPRAQLQVMRAGELAWLQPPPLDQETFEVENTIIRSAYNYWGKSVEGVDPNKVLRKQQRLIDSWLADLRAVYVQIFQLCEQYMEPQDWIAISGDPQSVPGQDRRSIQHNLNLVLEYDAKDLNTEFLSNKMQLIQTMLVATDAAGVIDRAGLTMYAANALDPALARNIVKPQGQVTQQEILAEQAACAQVVSGVEPPIYEANSGQNPNLRLQVIQSTLQSPDFQQFIKQNPLAQQRLEKRIQAFQFAIQQQQNAQVGKIGVQPPAINQVGGGGSSPPEMLPT